jgi:hypothetical protein
MIEASAPRTGSLTTHGLPSVVSAAPGVDMLSPPAIPRNAPRKQSERPRRTVGTSATNNSIKAGARKPRPDPSS